MQYQQHNNSGSGSGLYSQKKSDDTSYIARDSVQSSEHSTKNTSYIKNPLQLTPPKIPYVKKTTSMGSNSKSLVPSPVMTFDQAISFLLESHEVLINRVRNTIRTEFIPTSNGLRSVLLLEDGYYVNLSWVHSVRQL